MSQSSPVDEAVKPVNVDELEVVDGRAYENLEGWIPDLATEEEIHNAMEKAFDYRGDITLTFKTGEKVRLTSSIARPGKSLADSFIQYYASNASDKRKASYAAIARIEFSGKDRAAGKHWRPGSKNITRRRLPARLTSPSYPRRLTNLAVSENFKVQDCGCIALLKRCSK